MRTIITLLLVLTLLGCQVEQSEPLPDYEVGDPVGGSEDFNSVEELRSFIQESDGNDGNNFFRSGGVMAEESMMFDSAVGVPSVKTTNIDYSETNVQVQGVDEADIIKTDGEYIYTSSGDTVFIISAGEDAEILSEIDNDENPQGIFIQGDSMAVFGTTWNKEFYHYTDFRPSYGMTYFKIYDISDREDPELAKEFVFEGQYFQSRMVDGWVYFVTTSQPERRPIPMPVIFEDTVMRNVELSNIRYFPYQYDSMNFATIHGINMDDFDINSETFIVEGSRNMYMSLDNIYIASTKYINEWELRQDITMDILAPRLSEADLRLIDKIEATDGDILSNSEKKNKIMQIHYDYLYFADDEDELEASVDKLLKEELEKYDAFEFTIIHQIGVSNGKIELGETAELPGSLNNQFSMDEYDDVLRVATTVNQRWMMNKMTESSNHIYTLDEDMDIMDSLTGLAEGERIYSTRFMGDKLYMVTFRQVDPFFVIDLENPEDIEALGELKIPGFSRYLHPYDENTIIGIGQEATELGRTQGLKISLFDVSDVKNPEEVAKFVAEGKYSRSAAEYEHKAFLFSKEKNLLVIPAYSYDYEDGESYNGAMVFTISKDEIDIRGIIDHSSGENYYSSQVERSLYIEDLLYTKSPSLLRINELDDLSKVKNIELKSDGPYDIY